MAIDLETYRTDQEISDLKHEMAHLRGIVEQLSERVAALEARFTAFESRMEARLASLENRMDSNFKWMVGLMLTSWLTIIGLLLGILSRPH